jgi:hypothetical protein
MRIPESDLVSNLLWEQIDLIDRLRRVAKDFLKGMPKTLC